MDRLMWPLILLGHVGFWCFFFNRAHATAWPRAWRKGTEKFVLAAVFLPLTLWFVWMIWEGGPSPGALLGKHFLLGGYGVFCGLTGVWLLGAWLVRRLSRRRPAAVHYLSQAVGDIERTTGQRLTAGWCAESLRLVPWNRCTWMEFGVGELRLQRPDAERWDGLKIAHLSDFHLTGAVRKPYYEAIVEWVNRQECDLILLSGDLVDETACLGWIPDVFGRLRSRLGKYYVLGNHDLQIADQATYREMLQTAGCEYLAGSWKRIEFPTAPILLTGNDLPWYQAAEGLPAATPEEGLRCGDALRLCVAHSPDQLQWARKRGMDVMFAGHTHGGQICFPLVGPVISPSKYGVRYAGGEFKIGPMLLLVSRGISGDEPIRWHCFPQVNVWTLRAARGPAESSTGRSPTTLLKE
ncbi:MAG: metallophosphoesterase [Planctomycetota bacterium]